jgi:hypothetical protein
MVLVTSVLINFFQRRIYMGESNVVVEGTLAWAEEHFMNGMADEVSGNMDAPTGHFYRVERWIVTTNSQGFSDIDEYADWFTAHCEFESRDEKYGEWDNAD